MFLSQYSISDASGANTFGSAFPGHVGDRGEGGGAGARALAHGGRERALHSYPVISSAR